MSALATDTIPEKPATDRFYRVSPDGIFVIGLDTPDGPEHELYDERAFLPINEEQVLSFMAIGVRMPVLVRRGAGGRMEVVDGRRRTIESREANRRLLAMGELPITVPVYFSPSRLSPEMLLTLSVELNDRRVEDTPEVRMRKAKRMLERKIPLVTVARVFGKSTKGIENWMLTLAAPPDLKAAADLGMIPASAVADLARAPEPVKALEALIESGDPTRERATAIAKAQRKGSTHEGAKMPRGAVSRVLKAESSFNDDFIRGIKFARGELSTKDVQQIMKTLETE
jgi:ParB family chromosome partitioning protein